MQERDNMKKITLLLILTLMFTSGCSTLSFSKKNYIAEFHPIDKEDFREIPLNTKATIPAGAVFIDAKGNILRQWQQDEEFVFDRQGYFVSEEYVTEVMKVLVNHQDEK